ncbi:hypothetical protein GOP47_0003880 [Adiantum capillus-veneris]|uniref:Hyaluronan/mRNA-binding protein domain-containing protein n=1 Tax=Adiantum capillus-veneris TaxID=13818 RepID=A0A9D4V858_ADICA|nr:hypothetical protein GOP47_0003880 [Adiantum capillus-veneris]
MARSLQETRARSVKNGSLRLDRHSGSGRRGTPKKGGAGAKYTWGAPGYNEDASTPIVDRKDPNYDEDEEVIPVRSRKTPDHLK